MIDEDETILYGKDEMEIACKHCEEEFKAQKAENYEGSDEDTMLLCPYCHQESGLTIKTCQEDFFNWVKVRKQSPTEFSISISLGDPRGSDLLFSILKKNNNKIEAHIPEGDELTYYPFEKSHKQKCNKIRINTYRLR